MYNFSHSKKGETLVSIITGVVILGIAMGGVTMILMQESTIEEEYSKSSTLSVLQSNAESIVRKINTSQFMEKDVFSLYKNPVSKTFQAFTGTMSEGYKYIDKDGNSIVNTGSYMGVMYTRIFTVEQWDSSLWKPWHVIKTVVKEFIKK